MIRRAAGPICVTLLLFAAPAVQAASSDQPSRIAPDSDDEFDDEFGDDAEAPAKPKAEPDKKAPTKAEPAKAEPAKAEPAKAEPAKAEPAKAEPAKSEPAEAEPAKAEPAEAEPAKAEPAKAEPAKAEPAKAEPAKAEPAKAEPAKAEPAKLKSKPEASEEGAEDKEESAEDGEASEEDAEGEEEDEEEDTSDSEFKIVEGELASVGALGFVPWRNRVGAVVAVEQIGETAYLGIKPHVNYTTELWGRELSLSFGLPLRIELVDARVDRRFKHTGRFRNEDWDEISDYFQVINNITYGGKESHVYVDINAFKATSIGHGILVKRYNPNLNFNTARLQAEVDAFSDYIGGEVYVDNIPGPNVLGGLIFVKPLSLIDRDNFMMRSFSIGFQVFADINAPVRNILDFEDADSDGRRWTEIAVNQNTFQPRHVKSTVVGYGIDLEVKLFDERWLDWKTYVDYSFLETGVPTDGIDDPMNPNYVDIPTRAVQSGGFTWGNLFRMNFGDDTVHALRLRTEYRNYDPNYLPSYFDSMYDVQRVQHPMDEPDLVNQTKLQQVLGRDPTLPRVHGGYFELSYSMGHYLALSLGFEVNDSTPDNAMYVHLEVPKLGPWAFIATYQRRNAATFGALFDSGSGFKTTDMFLLQSRLGIVDVLHLALEIMTPFGIGPESLFRNVVQVNFVIELGIPYL